MALELEVRHLQLMTAVAAHGSLTRAGDELHLTQSALSHQLRDLESRLGVTLFLRVNRRMVLTPAGERLLAWARDLLDRLGRTEREVRAAAGASLRLLRLSTECYTCYHWLPSLLSTFRRTFPHTEIRIDVDSTANPVKAVLEGRLEVALVTCGVRDRRLATRPLFRDEMLVVTAPGHRFASQAFVRVNDFEGEVLLGYAPKEASRVYRELLAPARVELAGVHQVQLTEAMLEMVRAGLGVAVLARWAVEPQLRALGLAGVRLTSGGCSRQWSAVMPRRLATDEEVRALVDLIARQSVPARVVTSRRSVPARRRAG